MGLAIAYPEHHYKQVLPRALTDKRLGETRYAVKLDERLKTSFASDEGIKDIKITDVARQGIHVVSHEPLKGFVTLRISVSDTRTAEILGEIRWFKMGQKLYGVRLIKTDVRRQ